MGRARNTVAVAGIPVELAEYRCKGYVFVAAKNQTAITDDSVRQVGNAQSVRYAWRLVKVGFTSPITPA